MAKVIVVASGKGGVGKSTLSALLGEELAGLGHRTVIFEMDSGLRCLDVALGTTGATVFDMGDAQRGMALRDVAVTCPFCGKLDLVTASAAPCEIGGETLSRMLTEAENVYDFVIIDCPAGLGSSLGIASERAGIVLTVATSDPSSIRGAFAAANFVRQNSAAEIRLVIERLPQNPRFLSPIKNLDEVIDGAGARLIGLLWEDTQTREAVDSGKSLNTKSPNKKMIEDLAGRILGRRIPLGIR